MSFYHRLLILLLCTLMFVSFGWLNTISTSSDDNIFLRGLQPSTTHQERHFFDSYFEGL